MTTQTPTAAATAASESRPEHQAPTEYAATELSCRIGLYG
jgi:hypothetical protein